MSATGRPTTVQAMRVRGRGSRRRGRGPWRRWRYAALLGFAAALLYAPSAWATTYTVDNIGDVDSQLCTGAAADCSLRSAVTAANGNSGADSIDFDSTVFNGGATSTISTGGNLVISGALTITGGNCATATAPKPCVGLNSGGNIGLNVFTTGAVSVNGIAFTGASSAINVSGVPGPTVTGSWFGVALDGTTLSANQTGIALVNSSGATIGGTTAVARNVFADNTDQAIAIAGSGTGHSVKGNYLGVLPDGTAVADPGAVGISLSGPSSGHTIGGSAATAGQCDGACNLIDNFTQDGIRAQDAGGAPSGIAIRGNFIGLGLNGTTDRGNGSAGIKLSNSNGDTIGGALAVQRNYIAGNGDPLANDGGGVYSQLSDSLTAVNNYIGLTAGGTAAIPNQTSRTGSGLTDIGGAGESVVDNRFGGNGLRIGAFSADNHTIRGNVIGVGTGGEDLGITGEPGLQFDGGTSTIGGTLAGDGNTIGNIKTSTQAAVLLTNGASGNTIQGNFIGTTSTGVPEPNAGPGIQLGGSNGFTGDLIGGSTPESENVISNSGGDAILFSQGGSGVQILRNVGKNNGSGSNDLFFDMGNNGPGNPTSFSNAGILAPAGLTATTTTLSGTGDTGDAVFAYATYTGHGDIRRSLGSTAVSGGNWSMVITTADLPPGACVTANQTDSSGNSSEFAVPVAVGGGSCVTPPPSSIDSGPAGGSLINDNFPTFGFSSSEPGATFECKIDGGSFTACTSPDNLPALSEGSHTFQERAIQTGAGDPNHNPGLGTDLGATNSRTFTVDTIAPVASFISGPADGASIDTSSTSFGFSANEQPSAFECKVDAGSFSACTSPLALSGLSEGAHSVQVRATDAANNVGTAATRNFTVKLPVAPPPAPPAAAPTGQRAAALKKCKKKKSAKARKKCKAKANKLPV
jgi:hypothetical protein